MSKAMRVWISRDINGPADNDIMVWDKKPKLHDTQWVDSKKWMDAAIWHGIEKGECCLFELRRVVNGRKGKR
jgi:hypothetical protein